MNNISSYQKPSIEIPNSVIDIVNLFFLGIQTVSYRERDLSSRVGSNGALVIGDEIVDHDASGLLLLRRELSFFVRIPFFFLFFFFSLDLSQNRREDERDFFFMANFEDSYW